MQFFKLATYLEKLERTHSRNEMTKLLAEVLKAAGEDEVAPICYLLLGELLPAYHGVEFNIAEKLMVQILAAAYGRSPGEILKLYKAKGDLGDVAGSITGSRRAAAVERLSVGKVYHTLLDVAQETGAGSQERKIAKMASLLAELDPHSAKFITRIPLGKLRLGFSEATLLDALSVMVTGDKTGRPSVEQAYNVTADIGAIAERVKRAGLGGLKRLQPRPGIPLRPSLAERLQSVEEVMVKVGPGVGVEPKLDGFRTQIHVWTEAGERQIRLFSRNLENTTAMFPEIVESARKLDAKSIILDGEAIGYNPKTGKFAPFQETVKRKRKYEIEVFAKKIPLSTFVFDILYLNGSSLLERPFRERRTILEQTLRGVGDSSAIKLAAHRETAQPTVIQDELDKSIRAGLEGLVVKNPTAPYEAGKRGFHWIKLKATTAALEQLRAGERTAKGGMLDTIDCLIMGAYRGRGKRAAFGVGGFLLGVRGRNDRYYTISRLGTGLSDEQFREAWQRIKALSVREPPKEYVVEKGSSPDIWLKPALVVEILADELTLSPRHTAGRKPGGRGYSLRFPRLVRFRDDKNPEDATTVDEIKKLFRRQKVASTAR